MCYHYSRKAKKKELEKRYLKKIEGVGWVDKIHVSGFEKDLFNPVVMKDSIQSLKWGLIPHWSKEESLKFNTANAKCEDIENKASWRKPIRSQRCIVPATGFFEWREVAGQKYPYFISLKDQEVFSFAGIWDEWVNKDTGEIIKSFSIITCEANELMSEIHNVKKRMPVILERDEEEKWLDDIDLSEVKALLNQYDSDKMQAYTVAKNFMRLGGVSEEILEQVDYPELALYDS